MNSAIRLSFLTWSAVRPRVRHIGGTKTVSVHEAKTHLSWLLDRAHAGEEIVIAKSGEPYARLVPLRRRRRKRQSGTLAGLLEIADDFFEPPPSDWAGET